MSNKITIPESHVEFELDEKAFFENMIVPIMNAKPGTLAYEVRDDWARLAVEINVDKF